MQPDSDDAVPSDVALPSDLLLLAAAEDGGDYALWRMSAETESVEQIIDAPGSIASVQLLGDDGLIAYRIFGNEQIHLATLDGEQLGPVEHPDGADIVGIAATDDGERFAWLTRDPTEIWISDRDMTDLRSLYRATRSVGHMQWSPDGESLAVTDCAVGDGCWVNIINIEDGITRWEHGPDINHLAWHPTTPDLFTYSSTDGVFLVDLSEESEEVRQLVGVDDIPGEIRELVASSWWVDESTLISFWQDAQGEHGPDGVLWQIDLDDGVDTSSDRHIGWTIDLDVEIAEGLSPGIVSVRLDEDNNRSVVYNHGLEQEGGVLVDGDGAGIVSEALHVVQALWVR